MSVFILKNWFILLDNTFVDIFFFWHYFACPQMFPAVLAVPHKDTENFDTHLDIDVCTIVPCVVSIKCHSFRLF